MLNILHDCIGQKHHFYHIGRKSFTQLNINSSQIKDIILNIKFNSRRWWKLDARPQSAPRDMPNTIARFARIAIQTIKHGIVRKALIYITGPKLASFPRQLARDSISQLQEGLDPESTLRTWILPSILHSPMGREQAWPSLNAEQTLRSARQVTIQSGKA
ncbi:hypothetical protein FGO68_gene10093 [Halteria grandinella]|uniref:Uncharacterized protein n=1 Tax=Halteria grandinella TaxID=5974 RepID=A0A8J8NLV4_HALGN|nr:hypothetical protein FGO68_gene10093 [Halteria grandinella]